MLVKTESKDGSLKRVIDCITTCFSRDEETKIFNLICFFSNGKDTWFPLNSEDKIYYLNETGKTVDFVRVPK